MSIGKSSLARAAAASARPVAETAAQQTTRAVRQLAPADIRLMRGQKRAPLDEALVRSIEAYGMLEPLLVAETEAGELWLLSGGRRLVAAEAAGLGDVPAVVLRMTADEAKAARKQLARFAAPANAPTAAPANAPAEAPTTVGQTMPAWLL